MKRSVVTWCFICLLSGCGEGVGRALVGTIGSGTGKPSCATPPAACARPVVFTPLQPPPASVLDCVDSGRSCTPDASGMVSGCNVDLTLHSGANSALTSVSCGRVSIDIPSDVSAASIAGLALMRAQVAITADHPVTLEWSDLQTQSTSIALNGPITLRVSAGSLLSQTQVSAAHDGASFELTQSNAIDSAWLGSFQSVDLERAELTSVQVFSSSLTLHNVALQQLVASVKELSAVELQGTDFTLELGDGSIAGSILHDLVVQRCDSLFLEGSNIYNSTFSACTDRLIVDRGSIDSSRVDGRIESHVVNWDGNVFSQGGDTSWVSYQDSIGNNRFCAGTQHVAWGDISSLICNWCDDISPLEANAVFCQVPSADSVTSNDISKMVPRAATTQNSNDACPVLENLPVCDPAPQDPNPS